MERFNLVLAYSLDSQHSSTRQRMIGSSNSQKSIDIGTTEQPLSLFCSNHPTIEASHLGSFLMDESLVCKSCAEDWNRRHANLDASYHFCLPLTTIREMESRGLPYSQRHRPVSYDRAKPEIFSQLSDCSSEDKTKIKHLIESSCFNDDIRVFCLFWKGCECCHIECNFTITIWSITDHPQKEELHAKLLNHILCLHYNENKELIYKNFVDKQKVLNLLCDQ